MALGSKNKKDKIEFDRTSCVVYFLEEGEVTKERAVKLFDNKKIIDKSYIRVVIGGDASAIASCAFSGYYFKKINSVTIEDGVTKIGGAAFSECTYLGYVSIPKSVTEIGKNVFRSCDCLDTISVDVENPSYKSIDGSLYTKDGSVLMHYATHKNDKSFSVPKGVTKIESSAFYGGKHLESVKLPKSLMEIEEYAFSACYSLKSIEMPESIASIGNSAFYSCSALETIRIPKRVEVIGKHAFEYCEALKNISVAEDSETYRSISGSLYTKDGKTLIQYALGKGERSFTVPRDVCNITEDAFKGCKAIEEIKLPDMLTTIEAYTFESCKNLKRVDIQNSVDTICAFAFRCCESLEEIVIPKSVTKIEENAFAGISNVKIACVAESKPKGWHEKWNPRNCPVFWGHKILRKKMIN